MTPFPTSEQPPPPREDDEQAPLGTAPSYDELLDVAVQYTFPCSDPIAVGPRASRGGNARGC